MGISHLSVTIKLTDGWNNIYNQMVIGHIAGIMFQTLKLLHIQLHLSLRQFYNRKVEFQKIIFTRFFFFFFEIMKWMEPWLAVVIDLLWSMAKASLLLIFLKGPVRLLMNRSRNETPKAWSQWSSLVTTLPSLRSIFSMMHECSPVRSFAVCLFSQIKNRKNRYRISIKCNEREKISYLR